MKKITALLAALALIATFCACSDKGGDSSDKGYLGTFNVGSETRGWKTEGKDFQIYSGTDELLQTISFDKWDADYAKEHVTFTDCNGDGFSDLFITYRADGETTYSRYYFYDSKTDKFYTSATGPILVNAKLFAGQKTITCTGTDEYGVTTAAVYDISNGAPKAKEIKYSGLDNAAKWFVSNYYEADRVSGLTYKSLGEQTIGGSNYEVFSVTEGGKVINRFYYDPALAEWSVGKGSDGDFVSWFQDGLIPMKN